MQFTSRGIDGLHPRLYVRAGGAEQLAGTFAGAGGGVYTFGWNTSRIAPGTYTLRADLGDGVAHTLPVLVR